MFCTSCGAQLKDGDRFCSSCGKSTMPGAEAPPPGASYTGAPRRLVRTMNDKKIAGVCGGVAAYFGIDPTLVRFIALATFLVYGVGALAYIVGWIVMPEDRAVAQPVS
jgi:phage shock protein C